jgi:hypothetical protein
MSAALLVLVYALAVAWSVPALLARLTGRGISARLGLAAWLTAMASVLACAGAAVALLVSAAVAGWPRLAEAVCRSVAGRACTPVVYRSALFELPLSAAALAHERAHLAARHHLLISLTRGLAASFPGVPLFTRGPAAVARLAEMCADGAAARRAGRPALIAALLAMGTGTAVPATALAATSGPVTARVHRLLDPPRRGRHARYCLALSTVTALLATASGLVTTFAGPLASGALHLG